LSEKKHPILFGVLICSLVACGLLVLWKGLTFFLNEDAGLSFGNRIGVVSIRGVITESKEVVEQIKKYRKDNRVKAIILRID
jgi:protease-4